MTNWTQTAPTTNPNGSGLDTASPVFGDGSSGSANGAQVYAATPAHTLATVGDTLTFSGSVTLNLSATGGSDQFRIGVFDSNGQTGTTGWLGYFATNSGTGGNPNGRLWERTATNGTAYFNNSQTPTVAADERQAFAGTGTFGSGTYDFSLSLERTETGLTVVWSIVGTGGGTYSIGGTYQDSTPLTYAFDRVGFMSGGGLNANLMSFSNVDLTFTSASVPEPSTFAAWAGLVGIGCAATRRRR